MALQGFFYLFKPSGWIIQTRQHDKYLEYIVREISISLTFIFIYNRWKSLENPIVLIYYFTLIKFVFLSYVNNTLNPHSYWCKKF